MSHKNPLEIILNQTTLKEKYLSRCHKLGFMSYSWMRWSRKQTVQLASSSNTLATTESCAVQSVFICVSSSSCPQWLIPLFTQLQEVTGPLGINMSHIETQTDDGVVLWRRSGWRWKWQTISPVLSDSKCLWMHLIWMALVDWCGTMSPYSSELYIIDTESKGYIWISVLYHNTLYNCVLHNKRQIIIFLYKYMFYRWEWTDCFWAF